MMTKPTHAMEWEADFDFPDGRPRRYVSSDGKYILFKEEAGWKMYRKNPDGSSRRLMIGIYSGSGFARTLPQAKRRAEEDRQRDTLTELPVKPLYRA